MDEDNTNETEFEIKGIKFAVAKGPRGKLERAILEYIFSCNKEEFDALIKRFKPKANPYLGLSKAELINVICPTPGFDRKIKQLKDKDEEDVPMYW